MTDFIRATLEQSEDGATYEGTVYDRFLVLRPSSGERLPVFDMTEPISTGLDTGQTYEVVLVAALPGPVRRLPEHPAGADQWWGTVVEPRWKALQGAFERARPGLYAREWVLLRTPLGALLINPDELESPVSTGDILGWEEPRLDLYGVV